MGELMNLLALRQDAVLLSERFLEQTPYKIGDTVRIQVEAPDFTRTLPFTIVGAYRYFPTVYEERQDRTAAIVRLKTKAELESVLQQFYGVDGPGRYVPPEIHGTQKEC